MSSAPLIHRFSLVETIELLQKREVMAVELVKDFLERIERLNPVIHAFISVAEGEALEAAEQVDRRFQAGQAQGVLAGIPLAVKDLIPTRGIRTTCNSRLLENWIPEKDAAPITRLKQAGAIILGKTNTNEFGWSVPSEADLAPIPKNPWDPRLAAIGSSSGSAAALAAGMCGGAVGTDGGGSIRLPCSQMGLVGIKATHGRVSRLHMDSSPISEIGPITQTVEDAALMLEVLAGYEPDDPQSLALPVPAYTQEIKADIRGWKIAIPRRYIDTAPVEAEILSAFEESVQVFKDLGANIECIDIHGLAEARMANFLILNALGYAEHRKSLRDHPEKYGHSAYLYHLSGGILSAADYLNAQKIAARVRSLLQDVFRDFRALILPTSVFITSEAARQSGVHHTGIGAAFTSPFNATGQPAVNLPCGRSQQVGFPIGLQIVGPLFDELTLFQIAYAFEQATEWHTLWPEL